ncbi:MAG TPA: DUF167 family protein [Anseongella sp.]
MIQSHPKGIIIHLHIQPGASKTEVAGLHGDALKVRVQAPPVDGKANKTLLRFLASYFNVSFSRVHLLKGATGRKKSVLIEGLSEEAVKEIISHDI